MNTLSFAKSMTGSQTRTPLSDVLTACQPGDVLLTGQAGGLSRLITWLGDAPISHALLVVSDGVAIEARDARWDLRERGQGVRLITLDSLEQFGYASVIVVRPREPVDVSALQAWSVATHDTIAPFASVGLTVMGPLLLAAQVEARVPALLRGFGPFSALVQRLVARRRHRIAEVIADGTHRVICAELVYRGLLAAGVEVDLRVAQFATAMDDLPDARVRSVYGSVTVEDIYQRARPATSVAKSELPRPRWRWAVAAARAGWSRLRTRAADRPDGDDADLVTPADLLRSATMIEVARWHHKGV